MKRAFFAAVLVMASSVGANAASLNLIYDSASPGTSDVNASITAVPFGSAPGGPAMPGDVYAGGFNMTDLSGSLGDFVAWCLDLEHFLYAQSEYEITNTPFANSYMDAEGKGRVQAVFDANYGSVDATQNVSGAAFQLALWEAIYDEDYDLGNGGFTASGLGADAASITAQANLFLEAAQNFSGPSRWKLTFLQSLSEEAQSQNLVTVSPVPVPAAALFILTGLAGLGAVRRRRRRT